MGGETWVRSGPQPLAWLRNTLFLFGYGIVFMLSVLQGWDPWIRGAVNLSFGCVIGIEFVEWRARREATRAYEQVRKTIASGRMVKASTEWTWPDEQQPPV